MTRQILTNTWQEAPCHFLRLSTELRLEIYRYLFRVDRPYHPDRLAQYDHRHPEILRANRQIYSEAVLVLYSEVYVVLGSGHVLCSRRPIYPKCPTTWKHEPLGESTLDQYGRAIYKAPERKKYRHFYRLIFPRFQHVVLDVRFRWTAAVWRLKGEDVTIDVRDRERLAASFRRSSTTEDFVHLLSKSPRIRSLALKLTTNVRPCYERCSDMDTDESVLNGSEDSDPNCEVFERSVQKANKVAVEAFLESGILDPLTRLCNVQKFEVTFDIWRKSQYESVFEMSLVKGRRMVEPKYAWIAQNLKDVIQRNWRLEQGLECENEVERDRRAVFFEALGISLSRTGNISGV